MTNGSAASGHASGALERELHIDVAELGARIDAVSSALEHVLDVLETLAESREHVDWHVAQARLDLSRMR